MAYDRTPLPVGRLEPIAEVTQAIAAADTVQEVFRAVMLFAVDTTPATAAFVALYTPATGLRRCVYSAEIMSGPNGEPVLEEDPDLSVYPEVPLNAGPQSQAIRTGEVVNTNDFDAAVAGLPRVDIGSDGGGYPPGSSLNVPFGARRGVLGTVEFQSQQSGAFLDVHVPPLRMAANLAAIATHNLHLREEERRAHKAAEADRQHVRELIDNSPIMMAVLSGPEHVYTSVNRRYLEFVDQADILGKRLIDVLPEVEAQGIVGILDAVYSSGKAFSIEAMPRDVDVNGERRRLYLSLAYQPLRDAEGRVHGILAHVNDVTRQVLAHDELQNAYEETIAGWAAALDLKDAQTAGHSQRVTELAVALAQRIGLSREDLKRVRWGALLHDIGKMGVPDSILLKPGKLTSAEWAVMKSHTTYAAKVLRPIGHLRSAIDIPLHHHERWDGQGYPAGLAGEDIPLVARIFAVIDVYDALTSDRPYRRAWSEGAALDHIVRGAGAHFDPEVVESFIDMIRGPRDDHGSAKESAAASER